MMPVGVHALPAAAERRAVGGPQRRVAHEPDGFLDDGDLGGVADAIHRQIHHNAVGQVAGGTRLGGVRGISRFFRVGTGVHLGAGAVLSLEVGRNGVEAVVAPVGILPVHEVGHLRRLGRVLLEITLVKHQRDADLFHVAEALCLLGLPLRLGQGREQQPREDGDDGDHHQQLNKRECPPGLSFHFVAPDFSSTAVLPPCLRRRAAMVVIRIGFISNHQPFAACLGKSSVVCNVQAQRWGKEACFLHMLKDQRSLNIHGNAILCFFLNK